MASNIQCYNDKEATYIIQYAAIIFDESSL